MAERPDDHGEREATRVNRRASPRKDVRRVGPYRVDGVLGRGGMGVVYRAFDERLHREVALKALPAALAADPAERAQLESEARALALLSHPNVATIHGLEESDGALYLVLELVPGETLRERLGRGALAVDEALAICGDVAAGLAAVHRKGLVHRDLKPGNIMVMSDGVAKLLDFGLARAARDGARGANARHGEATGTPGFMSPECVRGEDVDARGDIWAWGCVLFECLAGASAFPGPTWTDRHQATLVSEPDWTRIPDATPEAALALVRHCLSKDPAERLASLDSVRSLLESARLTSLERKAAAARPRHALPSERNAFVGREPELAELGRLLDERQRLVSTLGAGGTGKTRLALRHAWRSLDRLPGGAWFCDLARARSVEDITAAVATALDVPLGKGDPVLQLGHAIAGRGRCLVVLDNFEQVARHASAILDPWLDRAPEASFLVTTRERLGIRGEHVLAVSPLSPRDGEALFVERARAARPDDAPRQSERELVTQLVVQLDGLPLAIELAAARLRMMSVAQVLARIGERFKLLAATGTQDSRQATLRATLDWSWDLLAEWEKTALAQLSACEGGFTLEAAEALLELDAWPDAPWAVDVVQSLLDKSLLRVAGDERFDMLVSVHEYASQKLSALGGREAAEHRHGAWFGAFGSDDAFAALDRHGGVARRNALARDVPNLVAACRRAVKRGDTEVAVAALHAALAVLLMRGPLVLAEQLAADVGGMPLPAGLRARVDWLHALAFQHLGRGGDARARYESALAIHREAGDRRLEGRALSYLGNLHREMGRGDDARACMQAALALHRELGDRRLEGLTLCNLGALHKDQDRMDEARACYAMALELDREVGDRRMEGVVLGNLGNVHRHEGRTAEAAAAYEAALAIDREVGDRRSEGVVLSNLGNLLSDMGRLEEGRACFEAALAIHREAGFRTFEGATLSNLGLLHHDAGRLDEARACLDVALTIHREVSNLSFACFVLAGLGRIHREQGRLDEARACFEEALAIAREIGNRHVEGSTLGDLGTLHLVEGRIDEARSCFEAGELLLRDVADPTQLALLLCGRARLDHADGRAGAARATLADAEALARGVNAAERSELGREITRARALLGVASGPERP